MVRSCDWCLDITINAVTIITIKRKLVSGKHYTSAGHPANFLGRQADIQVLGM